MNKQQAWDAWVKEKVDGNPTHIDTSSHGKAFSAGWDAATKEILEMCKEGLWDAVGIQHHLEQRKKDGTS